MRRTSTQTAIYTVLVLLTLSLLVGWKCPDDRLAEVKIRLPYRTSLENRSSFVCTAIGMVSIERPFSFTEPVVQTTQLVAAIGRGKDRLSIQLEQDKLMMLSSADFAAGGTHGSEYPIIEND